MLNQHKGVSGVACARVAVANVYLCVSVMRVCVCERVHVHVYVFTCVCMCVCVRRFVCMRALLNKTKGVCSMVSVKEGLDKTQASIVVYAAPKWLYFLDYCEEWYLLPE